MNYRKLRIAWSVGWGVAAVLLCVLWVRSYRGESSVSVASHWIVSFYGIIHADSWVPNPIGEGWADFVGAEDALHGDGVAGGFYGRGIQLLEALEVLQDHVQVFGELLLFLGGELEAGEQRYVLDLL